MLKEVREVFTWETGVSLVSQVNHSVFWGLVIFGIFLAFESLISFENQQLTIRLLSITSRAKALEKSVLLLLFFVASVFMLGYATITSMNNPIENHKQERVFYEASGVTSDVPIKVDGGSAMVRLKSHEEILLEFPDDPDVSFLRDRKNVTLEKVRCVKPDDSKGESGSNGKDKIEKLECHRLEFPDLHREDPPKNAEKTTTSKDIP